MQILEDEDDRCGRAQRVDELEQRFEEPRLRRFVRGTVDPAGDDVDTRGQRGRQRRQRRHGRVRQGVQDRVAGAGQRSQCSDERGVGQLALAERQAVAGEHAGPPAAADAAAEGVQEPRLAQAGFTRDEDERRASGRRVLQGRLQHREFRVAAHERAGRQALCHGSSIA